MSCRFIPHPDTARKIQELCRHEMIERLLKDILTDITISRVEGWDWREYPLMIKKEVDRILTPRRRGNKEK